MQKQSLFPKKEESKRKPIKGNPAVFGQKNSQLDSRNEDNAILASFVNAAHQMRDLEKNLTSHVNKRVSDHEDYLHSKQVSLNRVELKSNATGEVIEYMQNLPSKSIISPVYSSKHAEATAALSTVRQEQPQCLLFASKFFKLSSPPMPSPLEGKARRKLKEQSAQPLIHEWFAQLKVEERVLALTTVDARICSLLKQMVEQSKRTMI